MPQETLRLKFWEVALSHRTNGVTPFETIRTSQNMLISEVAERMGWDAAGYGELETGDFHASTKTILIFCAAMNCHPLDLYNPEAGPETPLPREIFYSLVAMTEMPGYSHNDRARSLARLDLEHRRAKTMVVANRDYFRPFLMAFGYSSDYRSHGKPLYDIARDKEDIGIRMVMDLSLVEAQLRLEQTCENHQMAADSARKNIALNTASMTHKAKALFGTNSADSAIAGLSALMTQSKDKKALYRSFKQTPIIVGVPLQAGCDADSSRTEEDKRKFFQAVERHVEFSSLLKNTDAMAQKSDAELQKFIRWQDSPKTRALLDWYEDCEVLSGYIAASEALTRISRAQPIPG